MDGMGIVITHRDGASRFEAAVDGEAAGYVEYRLHGPTGPTEPTAGPEGSTGPTAGPTDPEAVPTVAILHTSVDPAFEGKGVGSALIAYTLDWASGQDLGVLPYCPFAAAHIRRHPEHLALVPAGRRSEFGLTGSTGAES